MSILATESSSPRVFAETGKMRGWILRAVAVTTFFGALHHIDHVVRGNHVGWPLVADVNPFSYSLGMYVLVAIGLIALRSGRLWPGYWLGVALIGLLTAAPTHLGPWAVEPVADIYTPYADPIFYCETSAPANRITFFREIYAPFASPLWAVIAVSNMVSLLVGLCALAVTAVRVARRVGWSR